MPQVGDTKFSLTGNQTAGWYALNGQTVTSTTAAANATAIFGTNVLPDYTGRIVKGSATPRVTQGADQVMIQTNQLPAVNLPLRINGETNYTDRGWFVMSNQQAGTTHGLGVQGSASVFRNTGSSKAPLNTTASQQPIDTKPLAVNVAMMVWLS